MRQPTTAEVRLDEHKAASFGPAAPSILPFWLSTSSAAIEFRCRGTPQGRKIATNNFGIREMSVQCDASSARGRQYGDQLRQEPRKGAPPQMKVTFNVRFVLPKWGRLRHHLGST